MEGGDNFMFGSWVVFFSAVKNGVIVRKERMELRMGGTLDLEGHGVGGREGKRGGELERW